MSPWFARKMKECPRCESPLVHRAPRKGFCERFVHPLLLVWPYKCGNCFIRFLGFHPRYARRYVKPTFRLAEVPAPSKWTAAATPL
jgi:hypothetical protein